MNISTAVASVLARGTGHGAKAKGDDFRRMLKKAVQQGRSF